MFCKYSFQLFCCLLASCLTTLYAQRVGIGTDNPLAHLSIDSSVMIDQSNSNIGNLSNGSLLFGSDGLVGIGRSTLNGSGARSGISMYTNGSRRLLIDSLGRIGIGTSAPIQALHVNGNIYAAGNIGVGISDPLYDLHIGNSARIGTYLGINADPDFVNRLRVNGDAYFENSNVGINIAPSSTYSLYASGAVRFTGDVRVDGILNPNNPLTIGNNTTVDGTLNVVGATGIGGNLTVTGNIVTNSNKGIVRSNNGTQLKVVRTSVTLSGSLSAGGAVDSGEFLYETFGGTPQVYVGNMISANNSQWAQLVFVPFEVDTNSCKFRVFNHGSDAVSVEVTYSLLIVGAQ